MCLLPPLVCASRIVALSKGARGQEVLLGSAPIPVGFLRQQNCGFSWFDSLWSNYQPAGTRGSVMERDRGAAPS